MNGIRTVLLQFGVIGALVLPALIGCGNDLVLVAPMVSILPEPTAVSAFKGRAERVQVSVCNDSAEDECAFLPDASSKKNDAGARPQLIDRAICKALQRPARYLRDVTIRSSHGGSCVNLDAVAIP